MTGRAREEVMKGGKQGVEVAEEVRVRGAYMKRTRTVRSPRMTLRRHGHGGGLGARGAARRWWCLGAGEEALQIAHIQ